ncbi:MAG: hypothetical protein ABSG84_19320 [Acidobacteriaceae bacterium]
MLRFLVPAVLTIYSVFQMPQFRGGLSPFNYTDLSGVSLSLAMIPLLCPAALLALITPRWGGLGLAAVGVLGVVGVALTPTLFSWPFSVGVGPVMLLVAAADGLVLHFSAH